MPCLYAAVTLSRQAGHISQDQESPSVVSNLSGNLNKLFQSDGGSDDESFFMEFPQDTEDVAAPLLADGVVPQLLLTVFDHLPVLVNAVGVQDGVFTFWSREAELVTGYSSQEMVGNAACWQLLYPDAAYLDRKNAEQHSLGPDFRDFEWTLTTKSGEKRRISWSSMGGLNAGANQRERWFVGVDVTARADADKLVRARDKMLRSVFRYLPDMVHLKDGDGRWLLTNPAARATLGLSEREASGFTNLELADQGHPSREGLRHSALNE